MPDKISNEIFSVKLYINIFILLRIRGERDLKKKNESEVSKFDKSFSSAVVTVISIPCIVIVSCVSILI